MKSSNSIISILELKLRLERRLVSFGWNWVSGTTYRLVCASIGPTNRTTPPWWPRSRTDRIEDSRNSFPNWFGRYFSVTSNSNKDGYQAGQLRNVIGLENFIINLINLRTNLNNLHWFLVWFLYYKKIDWERNRFGKYFKIQSMVIIKIRNTRFGSGPDSVQNFQTY